MSNQRERAPAEAGISRRMAELLTSLATFMAGVIVAVSSYQLGMHWASDGPQAGYFPFYIAMLICIGSVVNFLGQLKPDAGSRQFASWVALRRVATIVVPATVFIGLIHLIGIYVAALAYISGFMIILGRYPAWKGLSVGFGVSFVLFMLFEIWFKVLLPKGAYNVFSLIGH